MVTVLEVVVAVAVTEVDVSECQKIHVYGKYMYQYDDQLMYSWRRTRRKFRTWRRLRWWTRRRFRTCWRWWTWRRIRTWRWFRWRTRRKFRRWTWWSRRMGRWTRRRRYWRR